MTNDAPKNISETRFEKVATAAFFCKSLIVSMKNSLNKAFLLPVALCILCVAACKEKTQIPAQPRSAERVERYGNGAVSRRVMIVDGKKEGKMTDYFNDGKIMGERWFKNGLQEGRTVIYYPSGKVKEVQYYTQGKQQEGDTIWYENGRIQFTVFFKDNKKQGYLRKWGTDGKLVFESRYDQDTLIEVKGRPIPRESVNARSASDTLIRRKPQ